MYRITILTEKYKVEIGVAKVETDYKTFDFESATPHFLQGANGDYIVCSPRRISAIMVGKQIIDKKQVEINDPKIIAELSKQRIKQ